jgi:hypothetical protein
MSTSLSDLPLPPGQQDMSAQQQFDLNSMIDTAASQTSQQQQQSEPSLSAGALQYQMDPSQIPFHGPNPNIQMQEEQQYMDGPSPYEMMMQQVEPAEELTFVQKLTNEIKLPIIIAIVFILLSLPQFNRVITKFIPRLLSENGDINMMGLALKALIAAIVITLVKLVV